MSSPEIPAQTRVLIVGGGPVGLVASTLLSQRGVPNVVVERRRETLRAPAAHVLRDRPMDVLRSIGVEPAIRDTCPDLPLHYITWCASLGGAEVGRLDVRTGLEAGQEVWTNCPQNLLEPILLDRARQESNAQVVQGADCVGLEQDLDGPGDEGDEAAVTARIRCDDGSTHSLRAAWVIAADGAGSPTRRALDIPMVGPGPQGRFFMVHFEADLSPWIQDRPGPLYWIMNPQSSGTLIVHDPKRSHVFMALRFGSEDEERSIPGRLADALGVPVEPKILSVDEWSPHVQVAERYREGRVFLVGDAAHRFPPTGGLGLNTGILDAYTLTTRLAEVEAGRAEASVLDEYEIECRPAAESNAKESFENMKRLAEISQVVGAHPDLASLEQRLASLTDTERAQLADAIEAQRSHFLSEGLLPASLATGLD
jgi:2,4-dichlorophenol 6-monooxygenase